MKALIHICRFVLSDWMELDDQFASDSIFADIEDMAPSLDRTFFGCMWQYEESPCSDLFVPTFTEEGLCFAFNAQNSNEIYTSE